MKKIEEKTLSEIIPYFEKRLEKAKILRGVELIHSSWSEFILENIFEIFATKS